ncbi:hypothetical protein Dsin_005382 [Dipteronia sinensis]|uniref:Uncharacterized protein n=1 Tax=Dipteronia sinensis TaxID=43782 RepID=A0AAE0EGG4_9ROSI|nr:hypothetical protein Dsin_005382 [Dipteronia sinensis]
MRTYRLYLLNTDLTAGEGGERKYGVLKFGGVATEEVVEEKVDKLKKSLERDGFRVVGEFLLARYPPWTLPAFKTNEVWAVERVISLENLVGKRVATGYPRFSRWEFSAKTALFEWEVETFEKGTDYFKSLNIEYVCGPLIDKKREKLALPRSEEEEDLGSDHEGDDNQTGNDNDGIDCSVQKEEI